MNDQELLEIVKKNRRKRQVKSTILNLFLVLLVLLGMGLGISKYYNLGPFEEGKVPGLPNNQISYNQTKSGDIASLAYFMSESVAFNFTGKNVVLKATSYAYGKVVKEEILSSYTEGKETLNLSGYLVLGIKDSQDIPSIDYSMNVSGAGGRHSIQLSEYGLKEGSFIAAYSFSQPGEKSLLFNNRRTVYPNKKLPLLTLSENGTMAGNTNTPVEEIYQDNPWVMLLTLEFEK